MIGRKSLLQEECLKAPAIRKVPERRNIKSRSSQVLVDRKQLGWVSETLPSGGIMRYLL